MRWRYARLGWQNAEIEKQAIVDVYSWVTQRMHVYLVFLYPSFYTYIYGNIAAGST
jgi:hypothetical protein